MTNAYRDKVNSAIAAAEDQIKIGKQLQAEGLKIIKTIQNSKDPDASAKLLQSAAAAIEKGCKIVNQANEVIVEYAKLRF